MTDETITDQLAQIRRDIGSIGNLKTGERVRASRQIADDLRVKTDQLKASTAARELTSGFAPATKLATQLRGALLAVSSDERLSTLDTDRQVDLAIAIFNKLPLPPGIPQTPEA